MRWSLLTNADLNPNFLSNSSNNYRFLTDSRMLLKPQEGQLLKMETEMRSRCFPWINDILRIFIYLTNFN